MLLAILCATALSIAGNSGTPALKTAHFDVTVSPTAAWIWRQVLEATPLGRQPKFLIHDRDADYGGDFDERLANLGITGVRTPVRAPKANAIGERIVRTIRTKCLDQLIVINESHLRKVLAEFADYYNRERPHRSLGLQRPVSMPARCSGRVVSRSVLGGLHHAYARRLKRMAFLPSYRYSDSLLHPTTF